VNEARLQDEGGGVAPSITVLCSSGGMWLGRSGLVLQLMLASVVNAVCLCLVLPVVLLCGLLPPPGRMVGAGSFGRVFQGRVGDKEVAIKVIHHNSRAAAQVSC
jgi:hypothetical protein